MAVNFGTILWIRSYSLHLFDGTQRNYTLLPLPHPTPWSISCLQMMQSPDYALGLKLVLVIVRYMTE